MLNVLSIASYFITIAIKHNLQWIGWTSNMITISHTYPQTGLTKSVMKVAVPTGNRLQNNMYLHITNRHHDHLLFQYPGAMWPSWCPCFIIHPVLVTCLVSGCCAWWSPGWLLTQWPHSYTMGGMGVNWSIQAYRLVLMNDFNIWIYSQWSFYHQFLHKHWWHEYTIICLVQNTENRKTAKMQSGKLV